MPVRQRSDLRDTNGSTLVHDISQQGRRRGAPTPSQEPAVSIVNSGMMVGTADAKMVRCTKRVAPAWEGHHKGEERAPCDRVQGRHRPVQQGSAPSSPTGLCDIDATPLQKKRHFLGTLHTNTADITSHGHGRCETQNVNKDNSFHNRVLQEGFPIKAEGSTMRAVVRTAFERSEESQEEEALQHAYNKSARFACRPNAAKVNPVTGMYYFKVTKHETRRII